MELGRLWKLSIPESKVYRRKTKTWRVRNSKFLLRNPKTGDISYGMKAHGSNMGRNMAIHDVITHLCYYHHAELSMLMHGRIGW